MPTAQLRQPAQTVALQRRIGNSQAQAVGQAGAGFFQAHDALGAQAQAAGEIVVTDLAFDHH
ncbi:hypothetical protein D9M68_878740 [compost metagenome]